MFVLVARRCCTQRHGRIFRTIASSFKKSSKCNDFATRRQFLLDHVEKVAIQKDKASLHGAVPIKAGHGADAETNALPFCIESEITSEERRRERMRTVEEMQTASF